jgi:hypothetical protein
MSKVPETPEEDNGDPTRPYSERYRNYYIPEPAPDDWDIAIKKFFRGPGKAIAKRGIRMIQAFDVYVRTISGSIANAKLTNAALLAKAHKEFLEDFRGEFKREAEPTAKDNAKALDKLADKSPLAYQRVLERLTPGEREEYGI